MADDARILELVEEALNAQLTPEQVCAQDPELLPDVRACLNECRHVDLIIEGMFPSIRGTCVPPAHVPPGARVPGIPGYEVLRILGRGGIGIVYGVRHIKLKRAVALKMLLSGEFASPAELARFTREAEAIAALQHPNIVQIYDVGEIDGRAYFTMELLGGGSLAKKLAGVPQSPQYSAATTETLAHATHAAHLAGIVHRDLKPSNILLTADRTPKISDFGLARRFEGAAAITRSGAKVGTPSYMAPEQAIGRAGAVGPPADIYSLGAILYEMLTGRPPFRADTASETERQVIGDEPVPPRRLNSRVPRDLDTICLKCLQKDPSRRYARAADLAADLDRFLKGKPIVARPVGVAERALKWGRRRPALAGLVATLSLAFAGTIGVAARIQRLENARHTELVLREGRAREAVETALAVVIDLRQNERWVEADHIIQDAASRLAEADSAQLQARFDRVAADLRTAHELDDIRQSYAVTGDSGYDFNPARLAYSRLFASIGIGPETPPEIAAAAIRASPIRKRLLAGLDNAAFVQQVHRQPADVNRLLALARMADPEATWENRFRDPAAWQHPEALLKLVEDARTSNLSPAPHQLIIIGVLLNQVASGADSIIVLREAQYRAPGDFWLNLEMANVLQRAGRNPEACQYYRAALAVRPTNGAVWTTLGVVLSATRQTEEAIAAHRKATQCSPQLMVAWSNLLGCLANEGRWNEVDAAIREASKINPQSGDSVLRPYKAMRFVVDARACAGRQEWHAAADAYAQAIKNGRENDSEARFEYAAVQLLSGNRDDYRRTCQFMLERCGENRAMRGFLVARACTLGPCTPEDLARAAQLSSKELRVNGSEPWSLTEQGALCCRSGRFGDAVPLLERSIAADDKPGSAVLNWLWLAIAHEKLGHADEAARWFKQATSWLDQLGPRIPSNSEATSFHLHNWLEAQILRREAAAAIDK